MLVQAEVEVATGRDDHDTELFHERFRVEPDRRPCRTEHREIGRVVPDHDRPVEVHPGCENDLLQCPIFPTLEQRARHLARQGVVLHDEPGGDEMVDSDGRTIESRLEAPFEASSDDTDLDVRSLQSGDQFGGDRPELPALEGTV